MRLRETYPNSWEDNMKETTIIASSQDIEKAKKFGEELVNKGLSVQIRSLESVIDSPEGILILWLTPAAKGEMAVKTTQFNDKGIRVINYFSGAMELTPDEKKSLGRFPSIFQELYNEESAAATALLIKDFPAVPPTDQSQSINSLVEEPSSPLGEKDQPNISRETKTPESLINPDALSKEDVNNDATPQLVASSDSMESIEVPGESNMVSDEPNIIAKPEQVPHNKTVEDTPRIKPSTIGIKSNLTNIAQSTGNSADMENLNGQTKVAPLSQNEDTDVTKGIPPTKALVFGVIVIFGCMLIIKWKDLRVADFWTYVLDLAIGFGSYVIIQGLEAWRNLNGKTLYSWIVLIILWLAVFLSGMMLCIDFYHWMTE